ncbi:MAG: hypothetical protein RBU30_03365 [Polyangia bacterium]|jgi:transglutaminase-like putative cysteine protease|nr:hypothetical protein [Polyangia bacterium]
MTSPAAPSSFAALAGLPFGEQLRRIDAAVEADERLPELLDALAAMRDHEPFAHAVRQMGQRQRLSSKPVSQALLRLLRTLPDTGVQRLLGGISRASLPEPERRVLAKCVTMAMRHLGLPRLAAYCLMDRWLKNEDAAARQSLGAEAVRDCRSAIAKSRGQSPGPLASLQDEVLLRVPGAEVGQLTMEAQEAGVGPAWQERRQRFASAVLEILESQPKSLSQANAEELLSRRVYTEPGHFLSELLQNAEDASATRFAVSFLEDEVQVWHDGLDFDAKDVVGVLSIGQTTKAKGQIGFFGVGFKSVYEISERPQIYSDVFSFEVADVSIPRRLARRPAGAPQSGTLLCLPLHDPRDPARRPGALFERAMAVPPETLLTLEHLQSLELSMGAQRFEAIKEPGPRHDRERIRELTRPGGGVASCREYLVVKRRVVFSGGHRETSRAQETPLLVAIRLDADGRPMPLPEGAATVFSHLPTAERPGFRFLLHAHFDLPIDRERLDLSSPWNLWAISQAGEALADAAGVLAMEAAQEGSLGDELLLGLLDVLPIRGELGHPAWCGAWESMRRLVQDHAILPSASGGGIRPGASAVLLDQKLAAVLASVELDSRGSRALLPMGQRSTALALELGAATFGPEELLALLRSHLQSQPEGQVPDLAWIGPAIPAALESLATAGVDPVSLEALPLLPDSTGALYTPRNIVRADARLRELYGPARPVLSWDLEQGASGALLGLLASLGVEVLGAESLVADLGDPRLRQALLAHTGLGPLLDYLTGQPDRTIAPLPGLPIFPGEDGMPGPLCEQPHGPPHLWRAPKGPLGRWLRSMSGPRPRLLDEGMEESHGPLLDRLGTRRKDLGDLLDSIGDGAIDPRPEDISLFHLALEHSRAELTPRLGTRLSRAPIFPTAGGEPRPLVGPDRAYLSSDPDLRGLFPEAPWVLEEVSSLTYLGQLGVRLLGAADLVDSITGEGPLPAREEGPGDPRRLYSYLAQRGPGLDAGRLSKLAGAPIWLDSDGTARPLGELRRPPEAPALAALWSAWPSAHLIEQGAGEGISAMELAVRLRLDGELGRSDFHGLVEAVSGSSLASLEELTAPSLWPLLAEALNKASAALPGSALATLARLPLFPASDGRFLPLGDWDSPPFDPGRCAPAEGPIAEALSHGSRPLLSADRASELKPFIRAIGAACADLGALLDAAETDAAMRSAQASRAIRRALWLERGALGQAFPARAGESGEARHPRLRDLPIWPSQSGRLRPSSSLVRPSTLALALGQADLSSIPGAPDDLLDEEGAPEAADLEPFFEFRSPALLLLERLKAEVREGAPIDDQPAFMRRPELLGPVLGLLHAALGPEALWSLPVAIDARGILVSRKLQSASQEELALARGLPIEQELADPTWAGLARAVDPGLAPRLLARRMVLALAETSRSPARIEDHPRWSSEEAQRSLYSWLLAAAPEISSDDQARGPLGHACLFPNRGGQLVSARQLLFDRELPEVFWQELPAEEIPEPLVDWLKETYPLEDRQVDRLVSHLVAVHAEAVATRDGARSAELLLLLARILGMAEEGPLPDLPRRLKLHRTIRVETSTGSWERPRRLLAPDQDHAVLLETFLAAPPERASERYRSKRLRRLLTALGATEDLRAETLLVLLESGEGMREGLGAGLALARYLAARLAADPDLAKTLSLGERRFIPDGRGELRRPRDLAWPSAEAWAVLGDRPECYPHPEFFLTVPSELSKSLPFRPLEEAPLEEVRESLARAAERGDVPEASLAWLEEGLARKRLSPAEVREALGPLAFLRDSQGRPRRSADLFRKEVAGLFGGRRGHFPAAQRFRRLADAMGIPSEPGRREILRFLSEVTCDALRLGPEPLASAEPELLRCLPRCLAKIAELGDPIPSPLVLSVTDLARPQEELQTLCLDDDDRLCLPEPKELAEAARQKGVSLLVPLFRDQAAMLHESLGRAGYKTLGDLFARDELPSRLSGELSGAHDQAVAKLGRAIESLARRLKDLPRLVRAVPPARWRPGELPTKIQVLQSMTLKGSLAGVRLELQVPMALDGTRLVTTPQALGDLDRLAELLTRERLLAGSADPAVVSLVVEILEAGWASDGRASDGRAADSQALEATEPSPEPPPEPAAARAKLPKPSKEAPSGKAPRASARESSPPSSPPRRPPAGEPPKPGARPSRPEREGSESFLGRFRRWLKGDDASRDQGAPERESAQSPGRGSEGRGSQGRGSQGRGSEGHGHGGRGLEAQNQRRAGGSDDPGAAPPSHGRFFSPRDSVKSQIGDGTSWLRDRDRPPDFGFAFAPTRLPLPYLYALGLVADRFDWRHQQWLPTSLPPELCAPGERREGLVALEGRIPGGELLLPLPMYGRLESLEGPVRLLDSRPGRVLCASGAPAEISIRVSLGGAPRFDPDPRPERWPPAGLPGHLLDATVPDEELPEPALAFTAALATSAEPPLGRALAVRSFVQRNYRYDPSYLEDPDLARWLSGLARGRSNAHLALLHAGKDARHLGAGVCYELGVLCCELLRRVDVPAAVATGWTFDRGRLDEPDHLWALALVPSDLGPRWLPLDASTTKDGRPLHASDRPSGPWRARSPRGGGKVPEDPSWSGPRSAPEVPAGLPLPDLLRVARHVERLTGASSLDETALRRRCRELLDDPERARALLDLLRDE